MTWVAVGIGAVGLATSLYGQNKAKRAGELDAAITAQQLQRQAQVSRATGQRAAANERRQAALIESSIQARAGGGGMDPTVVKLMSDVAGEGEYRALSALYEGESGALGREASAEAGLRTQRARSSAADLAMAGTVVSYAGSMYGKYGGGQKSPYADRSSFRADDPYRNRLYVGGGEGE